MSGDAPAVLVSVTNFRDFGGYSSSFGGRIARNRLYRSANLAKASPAEVESLLELDFAVIVDLRYPGERESERSPWPPGYLGRVISHDGERQGEAPHVVMLSKDNVSEADIENYYRDFYANIPFDTYYRPLFERAIASLATCDGRFLIHCTAGKDRTGVLVGLVHHILGVSPEDTLKDYMASLNAKGLIDVAPGIVATLAWRFGARRAEGIVQRLLEVREEYLRISIASIVSRSGSIEHYFADSGVDCARLDAIRARYII